MWMINWTHDISNGSMQDLANKLDDFMIGEL
jgi:hypothetical protein